MTCNAPEVRSGAFLCGARRTFFESMKVAANTAARSIKQGGSPGGVQPAENVLILAVM